MKREKFERKKFSEIIKKAVLFCMALITASSLAVTAAAGEDIETVEETRGVYIASVSNINFPSKKGLSAEEQKAELDDIVATAKAAGLNAIYFQVRPTGDALYDSGIFPTSAYLSGTQGDPFDKGFDPLEYIVKEAHNNGIALHAWVNPLRITNGSASAPEHDVNKLAWNNPARLNPDWTVAYADGKLYYDTGIPGVRTLIADGVAEIVRKYNVDGIIFDDYFYPYPKSGAKFNDSDTYKKYGKDFDNIGDFRRDSVNKLISLCYQTVKAYDEDCLFGVAPFGIWQNDDGENGGSDTNGLSSYSEIYCDTLAWIDGGYVDYVAPQLYWQFTASASRYDELVRWWNAQVDGSGVKLLISHAAYKVADWSSEDEIRNQVEFARSELGYYGSIFYGYEALKNNDKGIADSLAELYDELTYYPVLPVSNGRELAVSTPSSNSYVNASGSYILGSSDPSFPLYVNGEKVSRTKNGFFSLYEPIEKGKNVFVFSHKGITTEYVINGGTASSSGTGSGYAKLSSFELSAASPTTDSILPAGSKINVKVTAPSGAQVTATVGSQTVTLKGTINPPASKDGVYYKEVYSGTVTIPNGAAPDGKIVHLGDIVYKAVLNGKSVSVVGSSVSAIGKNAYIPVEVLKDDTNFKISPTSWYYDDYTPAFAGMRDYAVSLSDGYYKLRCGGYLAEDSVVVRGDIAIPLAEVATSYMQLYEEITKLTFEITDNVPVDGKIENGKFIITLFNVSNTTAEKTKFNESNPLFKDIKWEKGDKPNTIKCVLTLRNPDNFYGFEFVYAYRKLIAVFRNPIKLPEGNTPLEGRTIVLDAGHGGNDPGALGPDRSYTESDMNLDIVLSAVEKLRDLGAKVILIRDDDETVDLVYRAEYIASVNPDLCISVHQNSMDLSSDITKIGGLLSLYFADSGKLLAKELSAAMSDSLNRRERTPSNQRLAMVRNPKFPSALVEVGFITSVEEYAFMRTPEGIEAAAQGIADGVLAFYDAQAEFLEKYSG